MMQEVKEFISKYSALLPLNKSISVPEAEHRAGEFLSAMAHLTELRHMFSEDKIKCLSIQNAVYAEEMSKGTDKTVTVNKMNAEASEPYTKARESLERIENDISYLKAYMDIFNNAHIFYRAMARNDAY